MANQLGNDDGNIDVYWKVANFNCSNRQAMIWGQDGGLYLGEIKVLRTIRYRASHLGTAAWQARTANLKGLRRRTLTVSKFSPKTMAKFETNGMRMVGRNQRAMRFRIGTEGTKLVDAYRIRSKTIASQCGDTPRSLSYDLTQRRRAQKI